MDSVSTRMLSGMRFISEDYVRIVVGYEIQYVKLLLGVRYISVEYVTIVVRYEIHQCGVCENCC